MHRLPNARLQVQTTNLCLIANRGQQLESACVTPFSTQRCMHTLNMRYMLVAARSEKKIDLASAAAIENFIQTAPTRHLTDLLVEFQRWSWSLPKVPSQLHMHCVPLAARLLANAACVASSLCVLHSLICRLLVYLKSCLSNLLARRCHCACCTSTFAAGSPCRCSVQLEFIKGTRHPLTVKFPVSMALNTCPLDFHSVQGNCSLPLPCPAPVLMHARARQCWLTSPGSSCRRVQLLATHPLVCAP